MPRSSLSVHNLHREDSKSLPIFLGQEHKLQRRVLTRQSTCTWVEKALRGIQFEKQLAIVQLMQLRIMQLNTLMGGESFARHFSGFAVSSSTQLRRKNTRWGSKEKHSITPQQLPAAPQGQQPCNVRIPISAFQTCDKSIFNFQNPKGQSQQIPKSSHFTV